MENPNSFSLRELEKKFLEREQLAQSELFVKPILIEDDAVLAEAGIDGAFGPRERGHIKLYPEDFLVEEVSKEGELRLVGDGPLFADANKTAPIADENQKTVWAEAVKMGIDTIELVNELARSLGIEKKFIGTAGIKDKYALTAQAVSIRGSAPENVGRVAAPNFFLKNIRAGKGALQIGDLTGNHFTIFVRTLDPMPGPVLEEKLRDLQEQGFWNFFYLQRFGTPRLISHKLGLLILQERFEEALKMLLTYPSPHELPYFRRVRERLSNLWGDWKGILAETENLPYTFRNERSAVESLLANPRDFAGALNRMPEQVKLWVYAYGSFLFNKTLSRMITTGEDVPFALPLPLSHDARAREIYGDFFRTHGVAYPFPALKHFPYVQKMEKDIEVLKQFTLSNGVVTRSGAIIDFTLEKASYATTFLAHLFILSTGQPIPQEVSLEEVDTKKILGTGSIEPLKTERFRKLFDMRKEMAAEEETD